MGRDVPVRTSGKPVTAPGPAEDKSQSCLCRTHRANPEVLEVAVILIALRQQSELELRATREMQPVQLGGVVVVWPQPPGPQVWGTPTKPMPRTAQSQEPLLLGAWSWGEERTELDKRALPALPGSPREEGTSLCLEEASPPHEPAEAGGQAAAEVRESSRVPVGPHGALSRSLPCVLQDGLPPPGSPDTSPAQPGPCRWAGRGQGSP